MGSIRKMTKAELRQRDRDQENAAFLKWLARMDAEVARFLTEDMPAVGALENPWSKEGLQVATATARAMFPDYRDVLEPQNADLMERFGRYVGEVFVRAFGGRWVNVPDNGPADAPFFACVGNVASIAYLEPFVHAKAVVAEGKAKRVPAYPEGVLVWLWGNAQEDYDEWNAAGRPTADEWADIKLRR
ncbi:hypothetical protein [Nocardia asiatica]|uniref:hypothetical protein n=1 Tax=Nocardia asiatica TaxID=209252 RepID=UPI002455B829|nr:hypothetical protein [Nocardia asiatica]